VLALLTAVALFVAAAATANTRPRRRLVGSVLLAVAAIELAVSAARGTPGAFRGTFPDPDALAAILQICLAAAFARVWTEILTGRERALDAVGLSERFERRFPALAARLLIWALVAAGLLLTGSRAGILGAAAATVLAPGIGLLRLRGVDRRRTIWGACAVLAALLVGGFLGAFESAAGAVPSDSEPGRRATLSAWSEFRFAGSGFGTFREAFRRVQPPDLAEPVERAGSDVWGLAVTGGLAGVAGGALLLVASLGAAGVAWSRQRHREESATALAAWGAIAGLALQAAVGPGVFLPVAAGTLGVFLGAALGASEGA
jgi:hypothetical protein